MKKRTFHPLHRQLLLLVVTVLVSFYGNSQLDSISVSAQSANPSGISDSTFFTDTLKVSVWVSDSSEVGKLRIYVAKSANSDPFRVAEYNQAELRTESLYLDSNTIEIPIARLLFKPPYSIRTVVERNDGVFLPISTIDYP